MTRVPLEREEVRIWARAKRASSGNSFPKDGGVGRHGLFTAWRSTTDDDRDDEDDDDEDGGCGDDGDDMDEDGVGESSSSFSLCSCSVYREFTVPEKTGENLAMGRREKNTHNL